CFVFVPIYIVVAGPLIDPPLRPLLSGPDGREKQRSPPGFILRPPPLWIPGLFFGAVPFGIPSPPRGGGLAPPSLCLRDIIKPLYRHMSDRQFLLTLRIVLVTFTLAALIFALNSKQTMYDMVQNAYSVTLVAALVPLAAGIFWKKSNNAGAILSAVFGLVAWPIAASTAPDATIPPTLVGLGFSIAGMVAGSLLPPPPLQPQHPRAPH